MAAAPAAKLDVWGIVSHTSHAEAHQATALDLRNLALQDIDAIDECRRTLQVALCSHNLLSQLGDGLFSCGRLMKLDLSANGMSVLPASEQWYRAHRMQ